LTHSSIISQPLFIPVARQEDYVAALHCLVLIKILEQQNLEGSRGA
jgi:hypothetical protein